MSLPFLLSLIAYPILDSLLPTLFPLVFVLLSSVALPPSYPTFKKKSVLPSGLTLEILSFVVSDGLFLLEGSAIVVTNYLRQMLTLATGFYFDYYLKLIGMVITMISGVFVLSTASQRSIHDYLAKTRVVGEDEKPVKRKEKKKI